MAGIQIIANTPKGRAALQQHVTELEKGNKQANLLSKLYRKLSGSRSDPFTSYVAKEDPLTVRVLISDPTLKKALNPQALVDSAHDTMVKNGAGKGDYTISIIN